MEEENYSQERIHNKFLWTEKEDVDEIIHCKLKRD